jgi:sortase A
MRIAVLRILERALLLLGAVGLVMVAGAYLDAVVGSRQAIAAFETAAAQEKSASPLSFEEPDKTLWSEKRKQEFEALDDNQVPLALLEIERLNLQVPVYPGTDRITLNRGAGIVDGTAYPGEEGNMALSAHRDGFFRPLKDIRVGDVITVRQLQGADQFLVQDIFVTDPLDLSVLEPTDDAMITLITCYPFYYVGFAPDRLIVRAVPHEPGRTAGAQSVSEQTPRADAESVREGTARSTAGGS